MRKTFIVLALALPIQLFAAAAVTVDYSSEINYFSPASAFAMNTGEWQGYSLLKNNAWKFQHAGFRYLRFPGGSNSNEYHWNGDGYYDPDEVWHVTNSPAPVTFLKGFSNLSRYRGSTSAGYRKKANVTDTSLATSWKSFAGETTPQWIYLSIQNASYQPVTVNRVVIEWGTPYAAQYKIQYSNANWPGGLDIWACNDTAWADTSLGTITGTGGQADHSFTAPPNGARFLRILCLVPSSGTQYEIKDVKVYNGTTQVSVTSDDPQLQTKSVSSSMSHGDYVERYGNMDFEQFMSVCKMLTPPAEPLITINFFTGTTQEAKDWVYYANVHKNYGIKYWEIGNENAGNWESGGPIGPEFYGKRFIDFYDAMKAADPSITIIPQFNSATDPWNVTCTSQSGQYWPVASPSDYYIETFLHYLQSQGRSDIIQAISIHRYPTYRPAAEATPLANTEIWNTEITPLNNWINTYCGGPGNAKIWLTEYNDGIDSAFTNNYYNSLFVSSYLLNYLEAGGDFGFFFADFGTPGPGQFDPDIFSDFGAIENGTLAGDLATFKWQPRSAYWALWMLSSRFSAADGLGNTLVAVSSSASSLKVYANKRGDRKLSVILINTSKTDDADAAVSLSGFTPLSSADVTTFSPQHYSWVAAQYQSHADPDLQPTDSQINNASTLFTVNVPAYNIKIITMYDASQHTLTPSSTPTQLPTPTYSPTPPMAGGIMLDDCEDGDLTDLWGGTWSSYGDTISSYPLSLTGMECGAGAGVGTCYMKLTGTVLVDTWGFGVNVPLSPSWTGTDISMYDGVFFSYKGDGETARLAFPQADAGTGNFGLDFNVNTYWAYYQMPFSSLTYASWGTPGLVWTAQNIQAVQVQPAGGYGKTAPVYREINLDNIGFYKNTPTVTPTRTPVVIGGVDNVIVVPHPCKMKDWVCRGVTFKNLPFHTSLRIFTINGELVFKMENEMPSGEFYWDLAAYKRSEAIAPGLYIYIIMNEKKEVARGRIAVIR